MTDATVSPSYDLAIIVCGGRDFADRERLWSALDRIRDTAASMLVIHGGARGADTLAKEWCAKQPQRITFRGVVIDTPWLTVEEYLADWEREGKRAGPLRNYRMLGRLLEVSANRKGVVAASGGAGTAHMKTIAGNKSVKVMDV